MDAKFQELEEGFGYPTVHSSIVLTFNNANNTNIQKDEELNFIHCVSCYI